MEALQTIWEKYGVGGYPVIWLTAIFQIIAVVLDAFTQIDPIVSHTIAQVVAIISATRQVTPVSKDERSILPVSWDGDV